MIFSKSKNSSKSVTASKYFTIPTLAVFLIFLVSLISLSGCVGIGSKFDCNVDSGGRCAPMHHINQMANYGAFTEKNEKTEKSFKVDKLMLAAGKSSVTRQQVSGSMPMRSNEQIQQVWIAPYEDSNGNYHEGSNVYVVTKKGNWVYPPNKSL